MWGVIIPIPGYQDVMLPLMNLANDKKDHRVRDATGELADHFKLTDEEIIQEYPNNRKRIFNDRVGWALTYLKKAELLEPVSTGVFKITNRGIEALKENPPNIDAKFLEKYPEFLEFRSRRKGGQGGNGKGEPKTPEEQLEDAYQNIRQELADELLNRVKSNPPEFFENLVVDLLVAMGYGGNRKDAGESVGKSGDEGIDGIIKEDALGLDIVYLQAKRWENTVSRPEIHKFVGALQGQGANKGVFITTSNFSKGALEYVKKNTNSKIVLIDGERLSQLMIDHDIGVSKVSSYKLKKIDSDYFEI